MELNAETLALELGDGPWADKRLGRRLRRIAERLGANPALSFPKAFDGSAELEAAYRFFGNPVVTPDSLLSGHYAATQRRSVEEPCVLVIHDTTTCSFRSDGERKGLGKLVKTGQSLFAHVALVVADDGTRRPLGVSNLYTWARAEQTIPGSEQVRWAQGIKIAAERLQGAKLIHVMDREADDYALLSQLCTSNQLFVIRSMHDRLLQGEPETQRKLGQVVATIQQEVEREVKLSRRPKGQRSPVKVRIHPSRRSRRAELAIGFATITLRKPRPHPRNSANKRALQLAPSIAVSVVRVWEPSAPAGEPAVEWVLLTNTEVKSADDALRAVERYRARWTVEEYFKALKTGCAYETRQLGDYESLVNALAVFAPIACSLLAMRSEARRVPEAPAEMVVTSDELAVLRVLGRTPLPPSPTARQVLLAVAALGGHIKWNGDPGWLTLWRGYTELQLLTKGWAAAKLQLSRDQ